MSSSSSVAVDTDALMAQIRAEVARRKQTSHGAPGTVAGSNALGPTRTFAPQVAIRPLPAPQLPKPQFVPAARFHLNDFLALHDEDFIQAVYLGVLKRDVDEQGGQYFLTSLRSGALSKIEILGRLRYSPEGRRQKVPVRGLLPAFAVQHASRQPLIGGLVAFSVALVRLPRFARTLQGLEGYQHQRNAELESAVRDLAQAADTNDRQLEGVIAQRTYGSNEQIRRIDTALARLNVRAETDDGYLEAFESLNRALLERIAASESNGAALANRFAQFESQKQDSDRQLVDVVALSQQTSAQLASTLREALGTLEQRVEGLSKTLESQNKDAQSTGRHLIERVARAEGRLHEHGMRLTEAIPVARTAPAKKSATSVAQAASQFDKLYFAFEQRFRGSREDIRQRISYYLPLLRDSVVGREGATVLDIGCGRGEWLELLRDEKINARGVDISEPMVADCIARGLDVSVGDAIARLKQLPDNALGALTGFHIIEHVSLDVLLELIEQAHRVVQPGGLVLFETPNPENIAVGACHFYLDPTHQRPLPPVLMQFLVEAGGFVDVAIHRVNANLLPQTLDEPGEGDPPALHSAVNYLRGAFLCAPDYSVVGYVM